MFWFVRCKYSFSHLVGRITYLEAIVDGEHGKLKALRPSRLVPAVLLDSSVSKVSRKNSNRIFGDVSRADMVGEQVGISARYPRRRRDWTSVKAIEERISHHGLAKLLEHIIVQCDCFFDRLDDEIF